jgi:hypothetical protein
MQNVAKTRIKNPEANKTFKVMLAVLLSATFHNAHESPSGFEQVRALMAAASSAIAPARNATECE